MYDLHHGHIMHKHNITTPPLVDLTLAWLVHKHDEINCVGRLHLSTFLLFHIIKILRDHLPHHIHIHGKSSEDSGYEYDPSLAMALKLQQRPSHCVGTANMEIGNGKVNIRWKT